MKARDKMEKGFVFTTVAEGDLQRPDFFRMIGCKVHLGRPRKTLTTFTHIVILDLPKERTSFEVINRLQEIGIGIIASLSIPGAIQILPLSQANQKKSIALIVYPEDEWEELTKLQPAFIIFKPVNVQQADAFLEWLKQKHIRAPLIFHYPHEMFLENKGQGIWLDAPFNLEVRREMSFNLLEKNP